MGQARINVRQKIVHDGEINRARYMPQNPCVIATKGVTGDVLIFDYTKHPSQPADDAVCTPELRLASKPDEGYGLSWNPLNQGLLASTSGNKTVMIWDVGQGGKDKKELAPLHTFEGHSAIIEDVTWSWYKDTQLASVGDDGYLIL